MSRVLAGYLAPTWASDTLDVYARLSMLPEVASYPWLRHLLSQQVDMQLADLHMLLRFSVNNDDPTAGCNLLAGTAALNFISGVSVLFYEASLKGFRSQRGRGARFRNAVEPYYPFSHDDPDPAEVAGILYFAGRNPLVHAFGVGKDPRVFPGTDQTPVQAVMFEKGPLPRATIEGLLEQRSRPAGFRPTMREGPGEWIVAVATLVWGADQMVPRLFEDERQVRRADQLAERLMAA